MRYQSQTYKNILTKILDLFYLPIKIFVIACLTFSEKLRHLLVSNDVAFLTLDFIEQWPCCVEKPVELL